MTRNHTQRPRMLARWRLLLLREIGDAVIIYAEVDDRPKNHYNWVRQFLRETWPDRTFETSWMEDDGLRVIRAT